MLQLRHTMHCVPDTTFGSRFTFFITGLRRRYTPAKVLSVLVQEYRCGNVIFTSDGAAHISYNEQELVIPHEALQALQDLQGTSNIPTFLIDQLH